jgi:hypothetical protein
MSSLVPIIIIQDAILHGCKAFQYLLLASSSINPTELQLYLSSGMLSIYIYIYIYSYYLLGTIPEYLNNDSIFCDLGLPNVYITLHF